MCVCAVICILDWDISLFGFELYLSWFSTFNVKQLHMITYCLNAA